MNLDSAMNKIKLCSLGGLGVLIAGALIGVSVQEKFIYQPDFDKHLSSDNCMNYRNPGERKIPFDPIEIEHDNIILRGWFMKQENWKQASTVIFFHENAGNLGHRLDYFELYYKLAKCNIIAVAYRGYDASSGKPNQQGIEKDAIEIYNYALKQGISQEMLFAHGRSLGGAVAIHTAAKRQFKGVILENTFMSIPEVTQTLLGPLGAVSNLITRNKWESCKLIDKIKSKILFISSGKDTLIPYTQMQGLMAKCTQAQEYHIPEGDHNANWQINHVQYFKRVSDFITDSIQN